MPHRNEQPTLFQLTACDDFELSRGVALESVPRKCASGIRPVGPRR
jgi:hypothetical protein